MEILESKNREEKPNTEQSQQFFDLYGMLFDLVAEALRLLQSGQTAEAVLLLQEGRLRAEDFFLWQLSNYNRDVFPSQDEMP